MKASVVVRIHPRQPAFSRPLGGIRLRKSLSPGGEIESFLAYTQKSEGQTFPGDYCLVV